jgi:hypothetical protein
MMKKSVLIAGAMALAFGILQSTSIAMAHGHGGGHGGGHHGGGHHGGGHHGGGHHDGGGHHGGYHSTNVNVDYHDDGHHDDGFWAGAAVGGLIGYAASDPCNDANYRDLYPGRCNN